ncbi:MAG: hypothetical protein ABIR19_05665 [Ginsengibacter sp.]
MKLAYTLIAGLSGALVLTATHQLLHKLFADAPRMDLMGEEALESLSDTADINIPSDSLYNITLAGDIVANTFYYSLAVAGAGKKSIMRCTTFGLAAGIGGVYLPKYVGLTNAYSDRNLSTRLMTIGIYVLGGFISGAVASAFRKS